MRTSVILMMLVSLLDLSTGCSEMASSFELDGLYNASEETLEIDVASLINDLCNENNVDNVDNVDNASNVSNASNVFNVSLMSTLRLELISANSKRLRQLIRKNVCPNSETAANSSKSTPLSLKSSSKVIVQETIYVESSQSAFFEHVQGDYILRLSTCKEGVCTVRSCSSSNHYESTTKTDEKVCKRAPSPVDQVQVIDSTQLWHLYTCSVRVEALLPLCSALKTYSMASVFTLEADDKECGVDHFMLHRKQAVKADLQLLPCPNEENRANSLCFNNNSDFQSNQNQEENKRVGLVKHTLDQLARNISYCVYYRLRDPHCAYGRGSDDRSLSCLTFASGKINCEQLWPSPLGSTLTSWPVFVVLVSLTLIGSLCLLTCVVEHRASRRRSNKNKEHVDDESACILTVAKKPPRSLTEDDLEHISRLPSQEIVLVYFPDTKRFKDLNRRLRNWLITLDVNDVKDIYDEKCHDEILANPEEWVQKMLAGPEKRIILVCSRLAFECLQAGRRGSELPDANRDPHLKLLIHALAHLDREMRGNYRNLICVRYEDLKICSRSFSSENFNIVPGTEYVLPQHLEDVYRWIHPREPRPECWAETRVEVRELLDAIRRYRHHDDNMFTVNFDINDQQQLDSPCID